MNSTHERRTVGRISELRHSPGDVPRIRGHAAVFNQTSEPLGYFRERILPGAFKASIGPGGDDIRALVNHDSSFVLGRNRSGSLDLREDAFGLLVEISPPNTGRVRDLITSIERGDISQMSFGFDTLTDDWSIENGETIRTLKRVRLHDVSPVTFPAYPGTDVNVRSLEAIWEDGQRRLRGGDRIYRPSGTSLLRLRLGLEGLI
jgi:HK97 family phage prohead protease